MFWTFDLMAISSNIALEVLLLYGLTATPSKFSIGLNLILSIRQPFYKLIKSLKLKLDALLSVRFKNRTVKYKTLLSAERLGFFTKLHILQNNKFAKFAIESSFAMP